VAVATATGGASPGQASELQLFGGAVLDLSFLDPKAPDDYNKPPADAEVLPSGLIYKTLLRPQCALSKFSSAEKLAKCPKARSWDKVIIDYTGWKQSDGKMFDSSRNEKKAVRVNSVMPAWTELLPLMSPGESRRVWVPANLAYGESPDEKKPSGNLVFDIEMYSIDRQEKPPDNLEAPPADAKFTDSGLAYKVLQAGSGSQPTLDSNVTVSYAGYESNGEPFMLTSRGAPSSFRVREIPLQGLREGVQSMVPGEKRQFWIPPALAFAKNKEAMAAAEAGGLPTGALVFELELQDFK
jgi:peptidylprolyl isomerase